MVALFVALMFVGLVLTDLGVQKWNARQAARSTERPADDAVIGTDAFWQVPEGVHLSDVHTWFRPDPTGGLEIGADTLIAEAVGSVQRIALPRAGDEVIAGQPLFRLEQDDRTLTIPSTITGKVMAVNSRLQNQPTLLNSDPYSSGWICRIIPTTVGMMTPNVRFGEKAIMWLESEFARLREFLSVQIRPEFALGATSQDGGLPTSGCLIDLDKAAWSAFENEFLKMK
jgi:glycine cleavage system H protein